MNSHEASTGRDLDIASRWREVLADRSLHDLPYKIELNGEGKIEMSPAGMAWIAEQGSPDPLPIAPEICVEMTSPLHSAAELDRKARLYLEAGAEEVWIVSLEGVKDVRSRSIP